MLSAQGLLGGILIGWDENNHRNLEVFHGQFSNFIHFRNLSDTFEWWLIGVYGPCLSPSKLLFLSELRHIQSFAGDNWAIGGDFNITRYSHERSNGFSYMPLMDNFNDFIVGANLLDLSPNNYAYT